MDDPSQAKVKYVLRAVESADDQVHYAEMKVLCLRIIHKCSLLMSLDLLNELLCLSVLLAQNVANAEVG